MLIRHTSLAPTYCSTQAILESKQRGEVILYLGNYTVFLFDNGVEVAQFDLGGSKVKYILTPPRDARSFVGEETADFIRIMFERYPEFGEYILFHYDELF